MSQRIDGWDVPRHTQLDDFHRWLRLRHSKVQREGAAGVELSDTPRIPVDKEPHELQRGVTSRHGKMDREGAAAVDFIQ